MGDALVGIAALVAILGVLCTVLARMAYRNARDIASLAQRIAYLEGREHRDRAE